MTQGSYRGVRWIKHRICDVLAVKSKAWWLFVYENKKPTGDHFKTLSELQQHVDDLQGVSGEPILFEAHSR